MEKALGVLLMVLFGIAGVAAAALAWLIPSLGMDKTMATLAFIIGVGFTVFQGASFRHCSQNCDEEGPLEVTAEEKS